MALAMTNRVSAPPVAAAGVTHGACVDQGWVRTFGAIRRTLQHNDARDSR